MKQLFKNIAKALNLQKPFLTIWFKILAAKHGVKFKVKGDKVIVWKKDQQIILSHEPGDFGALGIVLRDFEGFASAVEPEIINGNSVIDYSGEKLFRIKNSEDTFYFHSICEPLEVTNLYLEYSKAAEGDVIFDIGAFSGTQTVYWSRMVGPTGKVVCFEPDKKSYSILCKNLNHHNCKNVTALEIGVYDRDGELSFSGGGEMGAKIIENGSGNSIKVNKLETIFKQMGLEKLDFIKMDIEGSEIEVLKSSKEFLQKYKPSFIIEPHYKNGKLNKDEIISIFDTIGYKTEVIRQGVFDYQPLIYAYKN